MQALSRTPLLAARGQAQPCGRSRRGRPAASTRPQAAPRRRSDATNGPSDADALKGALLGALSAPLLLLVGW